MSMSDILTITLRNVQGKPSHIPALSESDVNNMRKLLLVFARRFAHEPANSNCTGSYCSWQCYF
jgi:hypothetical protein